MIKKPQKNPLELQKSLEQKLIQCKTRANQQCCAFRLSENLEEVRMSSSDLAEYKKSKVPTSPFSLSLDASQMARLILEQAKLEQSQSGTKGKKRFTELLDSMNATGFERKLEFAIVAFVSEMKKGDGSPLKSFLDEENARRSEEERKEKSKSFSGSPNRLDKGKIQKEEESKRPNFPNKLVQSPPGNERPKTSNRLQPQETANERPKTSSRLQPQETIKERPKTPNKVVQSPPALQRPRTPNKMQTPPPKERVKTPNQVQSPPPVPEKPKATKRTKSPPVYERAKSNVKEDVQPAILKKKVPNQPVANEKTRTPSQNEPPINDERPRTPNKSPLAQLAQTQHQSNQRPKPPVQSQQENEKATRAIERPRSPNERPTSSNNERPTSSNERPKSPIESSSRTDPSPKPIKTSSKPKEVEKYRGPPGYIPTNEKPLKFFKLLYQESMFRDPGVSTFCKGFNGMCFHPQFKERIMTMSKEGTLTYSDISLDQKRLIRRAKVKIMEEHYCNYESCLKFSPDGRSLLVGIYGDASLLIFKTKTLAQTYSWSRKPDCEYIFQAEWLDNTQIITAFSSVNCLEVFKVGVQKPQMSMCAKNIKISGIYQLAITKCKRYAICGGYNPFVGGGHMVFKIKIQKGNETTKWSHQGHSAHIKAITVSNCGKYVMSGGNDKAFVLAREKDGTILLKKDDLCTSRINGISFAPDDNFVVIQSFDQIFVFSWLKPKEEEPHELVKLDEVNRSELSKVNIYGTCVYWDTNGPCCHSVFVGMEYGNVYIILLKPSAK